MVIKVGIKGVEVVIGYTVIALFSLLPLFLFDYIKNRREVTPFSFITLLYLLSVFGSVFLIDAFSVPETEYSFYATFLFIFSLWAYLIPISTLNIQKADAIYSSDDSLLNKVAYFLIVTNGLAILYFIPKVYGVFSSGEEVMNLRAIVVGRENVNSGVLFLFFSFITQFYPIMIIIFFYFYMKFPERKVFNSLLLLTSMSYIFNVLASVGRDGIVLWSLSFLFSYIIFRRFLGENQKRKIKKSFIFLLSFFSVFFMVISIGRFLDGGNYLLFFQSLLVYFSQQFGEFNQFVTNVVVTDYSFSNIFPILKVFGESNASTILDDHFAFLNNYGFSKYVFKTFLGSWYSQLGEGLLFFILFISALFSFLFCFYRGRKVSLGLLFLYTLYCQIGLHGVFYYKMAYTVSNLYMLTVFLMFVTFHYKVFFKKYN